MLFFKGASSTKRSGPSNTFLKTVDEIEKFVYDAQAKRLYYSQSTRRLDKIKDYIKLASKYNNNRFIQQSLGHALYTTIDIEKRKAGRKKRCSICASAVIKYMKTIMKEIGNKKFDEMICVQEKLNLMFAIDDTGSMGNEIDAVKAIAKFIVKYPRNAKIENYILSPFNDPSK